MTLQRAWAWTSTVIGGVMIVIIIIAYILGSAHEPVPYRKMVIEDVTCVQQTPQSMWRCP